MANEKVISDLLARCNYKYKDLTKRDITTALSAFKELNPIVENYVYPNGDAKDLISLNGTIPVNFKSNVYNIPVQLYLADTHPYHAPISYVRPTSGMSINVSDTVDSNGRIMLPCMKEWRYPQSDIFLLLNMMVIKFSEQTPLFAKSSSRQSTAANNTTPTSNQTPVYPSYPSSGMPYQAGATYQPQASSNIPVYPGQKPYPTSNSNMPPYPTSSSSSNPPPYPAGSTNPYYPSGSSMPMPNYMNPNNFGQTRPSFSSATAVNSSNSGGNSSSGYPEETIKPQYYKLSIVSAIIDKARQRYQELTEEKRAENDSLKRVQSDLEASRVRLRSFINDAEFETAKISEMTKEIKSKTVQLGDNINRLQHRETTSIDDAIITPAPVYRQLLNSFAEELAIQDLIYYLGVGLEAKTVSLETFLRQVRFLSRKQFMLRATMQKARERASLPN